MWLSPTASGATTALIVGGSGKYATLTDEQMATALGVPGHDVGVSRLVGGSPPSAV